MAAKEWGVKDRASPNTCHGKNQDFTTSPPFQPSLPALWAPLELGIFLLSSSCLESSLEIVLLGSRMAFGCLLLVLYDSFKSMVSFPLSLSSAREPINCIDWRHLKWSCFCVTLLVKCFHFNKDWVTSDGTAIKTDRGKFKCNGTLSITRWLPK